MTTTAPTPIAQPARAAHALLFPGDASRPRTVLIDHVNDITALHFPRGWHITDGGNWSALTTEPTPTDEVNVEATTFLRRNHPEGGFTVCGPMLLIGPGWAVPDLPQAVAESAQAPYTPTGPAIRALNAAWTLDTLARIRPYLDEDETAAIEDALALARQPLAPDEDD